MRAGRLDRLISVQRAAVVDDGFQTRPGAWAEIAKLPAAYAPAKGSERYEMSSRRAEMPVGFHIRWSPQAAGFTTSDRVLYQGKPYDIISIVELGRHDTLELQCVGSDGG
jgi:head-tail adaptor